MSTVDPGEGFRLLVHGEKIPAAYEWMDDYGRWKPDSFWRGARWNATSLRPMRIPDDSEPIDNSGVEVHTGGPYIAIEVHRAALAEIDRLQWQLRDSGLEHRKEIERLKAELEAIKQPQEKPSETPQAGQYWIHDKSGDKAYFIGKCPADIMVWQIEGDDIEHGNLDWSGWHHEPRCTGWDWQPDPEPEWFDLTPFGEHVLRRETDELNAVRYSECSWVKIDMSEGKTISDIIAECHQVRFRCLLKDAPPELVAKVKQTVDKAETSSGSLYGYCPKCGARGKFRERRINGNDACESGHWYPSKDALREKPTEWPKYYTSNPPDCLGIAYIIRESPTEYRMMVSDGTVGEYSHSWNAFDDETRSQITKEQADAILAEKQPKPAELPQQPKTETVVFYEFAVKCGHANKNLQLKWRDAKPASNDWIPTGRTETREVVR